MFMFSPQTIDDLLADPLVQKVMRADRVETGALRGMLGSVAVRLASERAKPPVGRGTIAFPLLARPQPEAATRYSPPPSPAREARCCC